MAGKNEYTVFDYLQWRGDLTLQQDPFNEVDNLVLCIIAYINLRKIDRLWSKNPKDAMLIGDVCARLTAADEQLGFVVAGLYPGDAGGGGDGAVPGYPAVRL